MTPIVRHNDKSFKEACIRNGGKEVKLFTNILSASSELPNKDRCLAVTPKGSRRSTASDLSRQLSAATDTTASKQTVNRRLGYIGLYARRPFRRIPITATNCLQWLDFSREHAM
ncbi:transposable element Tcb1 transposase [Trichonephila clavipes]|nr:transposable element Tcb1 transposase [Trichonephila clavipes]